MEKPLEQPNFALAMVVFRFTPVLEMRNDMRDVRNEIRVVNGKLDDLDRKVEGLDRRTTEFQVVQGMAI
ncbi:hypothetical protein G6O67_008387 [Ophiocordyceps sinensis]|uniref:Uncharacterized protein n=1 Tax=Ophiocordyceps sinensis TaxID=72228 RepID=A0A8H4PMY1_9HYPO|nr:hypothetical protein G6O67_008387 [Ophiocordyceps sinensis]